MNAPARAEAARAQCFYDIAVVTEDPVRDNALMFVEQLARRWRHDTLAGGWRVRGGARPSPQNILETVIGVYCMERAAASGKARDFGAFWWSKGFLRYQIV